VPQPDITSRGETAVWICGWCKQNDLEQVLVPYVPVGVAGDGMRQVQSALDRSGIALVQLRRSWDDILWPHATHGFFRFRKSIS
jgi:deoxyribodipyrimidine photo-lyase